MMKLLNLTPHTLNIQRKDGTFFQIDRTPDPNGSEGRFLIVRAQSSSLEVYLLDGASVRATQMGKPEFVTVDEKGKDMRPFEGILPNFDLAVVSLIALQAINQNGGLEQFQAAEFLAPGEAVRDGEGKIVGCNGFSTL